MSTRWIACVRRHRGSSTLATTALWASLSAACSGPEYQRATKTVEERYGCSPVSFSGAHVVVRRVELGAHDVAFRVGCNGDYWLAVLDQGRRTARERMLGGVSAVELEPAGMERVTYSGVLAPVPYPEARYSWNLTLDQQELLDERDGYIRLMRIVD